MYSYEERLRAVQLYIQLGRRPAATLRQLGYPTKNSLAAWCAEFEQVALTVRYDQDSIEHFKAAGPGWQTRMNDTLKRAIEAGVG